MFAFKGVRVEAITANGIRETEGSVCARQCDDNARSPRIPTQLLKSPG
jgi:hypothetical protein